MARLIRTIAVVLSGLALVGTGASVHAGDGDYDAALDAEGKGPVYFGFVRDNRGSSVPDAMVVLRPKEGEPVTIKANAMGLYRTHINNKVRPDEVEISCEKPGYKQVRVARRNPPGAKDMLIETNCTMQRL